MAAHPNGKRQAQLNGGALVPHAETLRTDPAHDIAQDTAWRLLYQELFDFAADAHVLTDTSGVIRAVNHAATEMLGARKDFMLGKPLAAFVAPSEWAIYYNWLLHVRAGEKAALTDRPLRMQPCRGPALPMMVHVAACSENAGTCCVLRWHLRPLTDREELERTLRHERYFIDSILETAQTLVLVLNAQGGIQRASTAVCALLHATNEDLYGRNWRSIFPARHHQALQQALIQARSMDHRLPQRLVVPLELPGGAQRTIAWGIKNLALEPTSPLVTLVVGHDITELEGAQQQALQAERLAAIGQVTAALAHEARNLLQRIQGGLDRLSWRLEQQPELMEILTRVQAAQREMTYLFDNVRSYAGPLRLDVASCNLPEMWREAWQHVLAAAPGKQAELVEEIQGVNPRCQADGYRIAQVFRNILENAVAAAPEPVRVSVTCRPAEIDYRPALAIAFRDNGPGLTPEQRRQIFEPFYTTKPRGTGLGMAIAKRIVEAHGGTVAVGDQPGGAEILVTVPRRPTP